MTVKKRRVTAEHAEYAEGQSRSASSKSFFRVFGVFRGLASESTLVPGAPCCVLWPLFIRLRLRRSGMAAIGLVILALASRALCESEGQDRKSAKDIAVQQTQEIRLRGRIVCLAEEMHRLYQTQIPTPHDHFYGFKTNDGAFYTLLRTRTSEAFFADKRLHAMELIVQGRVLPHTQILDAIPVGSVHNGKLYDLYYYCTVCAIKTPIPGTCMCCQQPVELVEKPLDVQSGP